MRRNIGLQIKNPLTKKQSKLLSLAVTKENDSFIHHVNDSLNHEVLKLEQIKQVKEEHKRKSIDFLEEQIHKSIPDFNARTEKKKKDEKKFTKAAINQIRMNSSILDENINSSASLQEAKDEVTVNSGGVLSLLCSSKLTKSFHDMKVESNKAKIEEMNKAMEEKAKVNEKRYGKLGDDTNISTWNEIDSASSSSSNTSDNSPSLSSNVNQSATSSEDKLEGLNALNSSMDEATKKKIYAEQLNKFMAMNTSADSEDEEILQENTEEDTKKAWRKFSKQEAFNSLCPLEDSFPYPQIRDTQKYIMDKLRLCDDKKFIVIEAMPGTGKSAIAKTVAEHFGTGYIITATKQLQDQYMREFDHIACIKGKSNYDCALESGKSCNQGPCVNDHSILRSCLEQGNCPYQSEKARAAYSPITVTSYSYMFTWFPSSKTFRPRDILVLDECHLLDQLVTSWAAIHLNIAKLQNKFHILDKIKENDFGTFVRLTGMDFNEGWDEDNEWFVNTIYTLLSYKYCDLERVIKQYGLTKEALSIITPGSKDVFSKNVRDKIINIKEELATLINKIKMFLKTEEKNTWLITPEGLPDNSRELTIEPLYINKLFKENIDKLGKKHIILMSATILNVKLFCEELGLSREEVGIIRVGSTFDPYKSPIIFRPSGKMNYASISKTLPNIIATVRDIIYQHSDERGIIHTGNYRIAEEIVNKIPDKRLIMKKGFESNEALLKRHEKTSNGILVSPSLNTGTDLKDDLSRFQIIVKMPFTSLGDKRIKKKADLDSNWYICEMLRTLVQASGRSTRSADDHSVTYVLDSSFSYWINQYHSWLPKQFLERIKVGKEILQKQLEEANDDDNW